MSSSGRVAFDLNFQISPIALIGGIAASMPAGKIMILNLTQAGSFAQGITGQLDDTDPNDYFCRFVPLAGATLIDQALGDYPLANQQVAANAVIEQPLQISMLMIAPAKNRGDYQNKQAIISGLKASLDQHNLSGGLYNVLTPSYLYQNCILKMMRDVTPEGATKQKQAVWQLDFIQPLVTLASAQAAQNSLMQKLTNGCPVVQPADGSPISYSGFLVAVGDPANPSTSSVIPSSQNLSSPALTLGFNLPGSGVVNAAAALLGGKTTAAVSTALSAFNLSKVVTAAANNAVAQVGSSIAGITQVASLVGVRAASTAALYAGIPGVGQIAAQFSVGAAQNTLSAATQSLQRGIAAQVGSAGQAALQVLHSAATDALTSAQAALQDVLPQ